MIILEALNRHDWGTSMPSDKRDPTSLSYQVQRDRMKVELMSQDKAVKIKQHSERYAQLDTFAEARAQVSGTKCMHLISEGFCKHETKETNKQCNLETILPDKTKVLTINIKQKNQLGKVQYLPLDQARV